MLHIANRAFIYTAILILSVSLIDAIFGQANYAMLCALGIFTMIFAGVNVVAYIEKRFQ